MSSAAAPARTPALRFRDELTDFRRFILRPRLAPRLAGHGAGDGFWVDLFPRLSLRRMLQWALFLWAINLVFLGPIAVAAATAAGATHRLDISNMPWLQALLWAPIVEELVFRYGLRRPGALLWLVPLAVAAMLTGPRWAGMLMLAALIVLLILPRMAGMAVATSPTPWRVRQLYRRVFPAVFHFSSIAFAAVHLYNFNLQQTVWWLLPLLVLPQWMTGMVLGWQRVRRGIGASIFLHALFNGGPLLVVWIILQTAPDMVT